MSDFQNKNKGVELVCHSAITNKVYKKLYEEDRVDSLVGVIQVCSRKGYTMEQTIQVVLKHFGGYITEEELTLQTFQHMVQTHPDIGEAWGYGGVGEDVRDMIIKNHAFKLATQSENLEDIETYRRIYDKSEVSQKDMRTIVNMNIRRK